MADMTQAELQLHRCIIDEASDDDVMGYIVQVHNALNVTAIGMLGGGISSQNIQKMGRREFHIQTADGECDVERGA